MPSTHTAVTISKSMLRLSYTLLYGALCLNIFAAAESKKGRFDPVLAFQILLTIPIALIVILLMHHLLRGLAFFSPALTAMIDHFEKIQPWGWQSVFYYGLCGVLGYIQWFYLFPKIGEKLSDVFRRKSSASKAAPNSIIAPLGAIVRFALLAYMLYWSWWAFAAVL